MLCASLCFVLAAGGHGIKVERSNSELVLEPLACAFCLSALGGLAVSKDVRLICCKCMET